MNKKLLDCFEWETREYEERKLIREFVLERLRAELRNKSDENKLKAGNRFYDPAMFVFCQENVPQNERDERFPPSEVKGRGTEKNNLFKIVEGKEFNVYRNSDCEVKMKAGLCEGRVKAVAKGAQRVINPDNIGRAVLN
ncbi:hypothetical protein TNCV_2300501 [Trichonephila clavipes]|nr:hypothetical protein TNCV_2300501 [Trichonephila clavipes]